LLDYLTTLRWIGYVLNTSIFILMECCHLQIGRLFTKCPISFIFQVECPCYT